MEEDCCGTCPILSRYRGFGLLRSDDGEGAKGKILSI